MLGRIPIDLLMVGAGDHHHLPCDPRAFEPRTLPARVVERRPEFVPLACQQHGGAVDVFDTHGIEVGLDGVRCGHLCHRPVKRPVPGVVLGRVAGLAGLRGDEAVIPVPGWVCGRHALLVRTGARVTTAATPSAAEPRRIATIGRDRNLAEVFDGSKEPSVRRSPRRCRRMSHRSRSFLIPRHGHHDNAATLEPANRIGVTISSSGV